MGNVRNWAVKVGILCFILFLPWVQAAAPKIAIKANKIEHSLTEKVTYCYGTEQEPVQVNYGTWELQGQYVSWQENTGLILIKGKVTVVQKGAEPMTLTCQELRYWPEREQMEAKGSVVLERGTLKATAGFVLAEKEQIVLSENPLLTRDGQKIQGETIKLLLSPEEKILVEKASLEIEAGEK